MISKYSPFCVIINAFNLFFKKYLFVTLKKKRANTGEGNLGTKLDLEKWVVLFAHYDECVEVPAAPKRHLAPHNLNPNSFSRCVLFWEKFGTADVTTQRTTLGADEEDGAHAAHGLRLLGPCNVFDVLLRASQRGRSRGAEGGRRRFPHASRRGRTGSPPRLGACLH